MDDLAVDSDEEVDYSKMDQVTTTPCMHYCFVQFLIRTNLLLTASLSFSASDAKLAFENTPKQWTTNLSIIISVSDVTTQTWNKSISFYSFIIYTSWGYLYLWYPTRITIHKLTWIVKRRRRRGANFFCLIKCLVFYNDIIILLLLYEQVLMCLSDAAGGGTAALPLTLLQQIVPFDNPKAFLLFYFWWALCDWTWALIWRRSVSSERTGR